MVGEGGRNSEVLCVARGDVQALLPLEGSPAAGHLVYPWGFPGLGWSPE